jgi:hypothetical protein
MQYTTIIFDREQLYYTKNKEQIMYGILTSKYMENIREVYSLIG